MVPGRREEGGGRLIVLGGTTASGKSALALAIAQAIGGAVVNADSQQLFAGLPILTAAPDAGERARAPHHLYGALDPGQAPSVGRWLREVEPVLTRLTQAGVTAIVTGGSGLYLKALLYGLPAMPEIDDGLRRELAEWATDLPTTAIHARLVLQDPLMAARLRPSDRQRCMRALEVVLGTGRSLAHYQDLPAQAPIAGTPVGAWALLPSPAVTAPRIEARLATMLARGALDEVARVLARVPDALALPVAKVHGFRELAAVARGELALEEASRRIEAQTRQYAKRQRTWFRHQLPELRPIEATGDDPDMQRVLVAQVRSGMAGAVA